MKPAPTRTLAILLVLTLFFAAASSSARAAGTVSLGALGAAYSQDFNTLANTGTSSSVPTGWDFSETGTNANTLYNTGTGSGNAGDTYSFGSSGSSDRAFGGLLSGSLTPTFGASFTNDTGTAITELAVSYTGEQWRLGTTGRADRIDFQLSTDATSLATGTWTDYDSLDFTAPTTGPTAGALDGNAAANRTPVSFTITGLNIAPGSTFWIRWTDFNASGADDGLSVDDFSLTPDALADPTDLTGTGAASPDPVNAGDPSLLTVAVIPGANPASTGLVVVCDLSAIGGSAAQTFFDDGSNGDASPGDLTFSYLATVSGGTSAGEKTLACTITDAQARSGSADIELTVVTPPAAALVINEVDYDQPGTDAAEFVEILNNGPGSVDLSLYTLELVNGTGGGASIYVTANLPAVTLAAGEYFVVCGDAANVPNCDLDISPDTNLIQNGAPDAVGLRRNGVLVDAVSYEGNSGAPYTEGSGVGLEDDPAYVAASLSRCPDGTDTDQNNVDFSLQAATPGAANACLPVVVINEVDYDQPSTDTAEYVELRNNGIFPVDLSGFTLELINGNAGGAVHYSGSPIALPSVTLAAGDYFVICGNAANVPNCDLDVSPDSNLIQNGAPDAIGLRYGTVLIDAVSYEGDTAAPYTEGSGSGLEDTAGAGEGISRCPDGSDTDQNNADFSLRPNTPGAANDCVVDAAPEVASTSPADGAPDAAIQTNISIDFSENVTVTGSWFDIACTVSGAHTAAVSGGPQAYTLDPDTDFTSGDSCTVTVYAAGVADQDGTPDNMAADHVFGFTAIDVCALAYTPIYTIQGSGSSAAVLGPVSTQGIVVGDYEGPSPALRGFYIQDPTGDGDAATSDGIFVFNFSDDDVSLGDLVRVSGMAEEFQDQTQIGTVTAISLCGTGSVAPVDVTLPVPSADYLERFEGMLVRFAQTLYVTEHFQLGRFGQVVLSSGGRLAQPTNVVLPGAPALALQAQNNLNRIILDDASQSQNPDPIVFARGGLPLSAGNTLRGGDTATNPIGVLTYTWAGNAASGNAYRLRPLQALGGFIEFNAANPRPASAPAVGGSLRVVGMNLLNFFNTFGATACTNGVTGGTTECRGADDAFEFSRQWPKTVAAILALDADVIGVNEIENDGYGAASALQFLVDRLNDATAPGTYAFIDVDAATGQVDAMGSDAIRVALIYRPGSVTPVGQTAALNTTAFINGGDSGPRNRASLLQAFQDNATGAVFLVNVNHLKSKGSACDAPDAGDGQGNCNQVRVNAVNELLSWFASDPTGTGDPDILMIGDYNAYAMEDPITTLLGAGFTNMVLDFLGPDAYSYVFDGQWGYLDHALASASMLAQVTGVGDYHINSDEPSVLDYNDDFKSPGQIISLYAPDEFRVSDHDPVIIGLALNGPPSIDVDPATQTVQYSDPVATVTITGTDHPVDLPPALTTEWNVDGGSFTSGLPGWLSLGAPSCGPTECTWSLTGTALTAPGVYIVRATLTDSDGNTDTADITITVTQEDARAAYTGALFVSTVSTSSGAATVSLAATVQDISVTPDAAGDVDPGDIRNATVTFVDRGNGDAVLCTASVGLVNPGDLQTGTATCDWTTDIGNADSLSVQVGVVVGGYYLRDSTADDALVTISKPFGSEFITGGGYLLLDGSAGALAGDDGTKANFGFNVKYGKNGRNLKGSATILVRRLEADGIVHTYLIKATALNSLAVQAGDGTAVFVSKANIQDVTDPDNPVSIAGNAVLQLVLEDNGEPGAGDLLGITLWDKDGGLWFASRWDGVQTVPQNLDGGNLKVD